MERGLEDEITRAYTDAGLTVVALRRLAPSAEVVAAHYAEHEGKPYYPGLCADLLSGTVVALDLEGEDAVARIRLLNGATDPAAAAEGTLRRQFGLGVPCNSVHGADSVEAAARERQIWFH